MRKIVLLAVPVLLFAASAILNAAPANINAPMDNAQVIQLSKAGLGDDVVIQKIKAGPTAFDTSTDGILALKTAGITEKVIGAMISPVPAPTAPAEASSSYATPRKDGVFLFHPSLDTPAVMPPQMTASQGHMNPLKLVGQQYAMLAGKAPKQQLNSVVNGENAKVHLPDGNNVVIIAKGRASSFADQLQFLQLTAKKGKRIINTQIATTTGLEEGKSIEIPFTVKDLPDGSVKMTPDSPLAPGHYGLAAAGMVIAFDIDPSSSTQQALKVGDGK